MENMISIGCIVFGTIFSIMLIKVFVEIILKKRTYQKGIVNKVGTLFFCLVYVAMVVIVLQICNTEWTDIIEQYHTSILIGMVSFGIFLCYFLLTSWFTNEKLRVVTVSLIGLAGALGYAVIMLVIDMVIKGKNNHVYFAFFVLAMATYVYAQKITRNDMVEFANGKVVKLRKKLFYIVLDTRQEKYEKIDLGRIYTCINNDMEILGNNIRDIITVLTNALTIIACFGYLAFLNFKCFIVSLIIFVVAVSLQMIYVNQQEKIFIKLMMFQQNVYNALDSLAKGHKELVVNRRKKNEFKEDFSLVNKQYTDTRIYAEKKKTNMFILGQSLLYVVIGCVIFLYPVLFKHVPFTVLQSYALVFLFILSPVSYLVDLLPRAIETNVSYGRIKQLINELEVNVEEMDEVETITHVDSIELKDVCYQYQSDQPEEEGFEIGPINFKLEANKIHFIVGSNGSGKSTLVKILTGLYEETSGNVLINGEKTTANKRCELFSSVYSDYYLFKKLYGISTEGKEKEIQYYLEQLRIQKKVTIQDRELSTVELSSGQRKRVALLLCYLDDKDIYVFDEWAADQDMVFREFFYKELLPRMKAEGKTVIAITHDDRYFDVADQVIHMDMGKVRK